MIAKGKTRPPASPRAQAVEALAFCHERGLFSGRRDVRWTRRGDAMIRKLLIAGAAIAAIGAASALSQPAEASGAVVSATARGLDKAAVSARAEKKLTHKINHWAHQNKLTKVRVGKAATTCSAKGPVTTCTSSAKVKS
jgi:hypothetical protein